MVTTVGSDLCGLAVLISMSRATIWQPVATATRSLCARILQLMAWRTLTSAPMIRQLSAVSICTVPPAA